MFDQDRGRRGWSEEEKLRFDAHLVAQCALVDALTEKTAESTGWIDRLRSAVRVENRAAATQFVTIGELFAYRMRRAGETEDWAIDTMAAVAAEIAAALRTSQGLAASKLHYARVMRERLPETGAVFSAGDIGFDAFATIAYRTDCIQDSDVLARVDKVIAANVARWPSLSRGRLSAKVDQIVARVDSDAVRRRKERRAGREVSIWDDSDGLSHVDGTLAPPDAHALDERLTALAATVCPDDPRTRNQRRADALGALAVGADRLGCGCTRSDCPAGGKVSSPVVIHVIAEHSALTGITGSATGYQLGAEGLITADLLAELAGTAKLMPLTHPGCSAPEPGYRPSKALADFVRCRDLTCRWPGCDVPATRCEIDHTTPWSQGGPTHAGNLKCYCPTHHLVKTFWGWTEQQLADGTLILTSPAGHTHVTTPGSALLFPSLCHAVGGMPAPEAAPPVDYCADRTAMMPKRRRTRDRDRAHRVAAERRANRAARTGASGAAEPDPNAEPPPF